MNHVNWELLVIACSVLCLGFAVIIELGQSRSNPVDLKRNPPNTSDTDVPQFLLFGVVLLLCLLLMSKHKPDSRSRGAFQRRNANNELHFRSTDTNSAAQRPPQLAGYLVFFLPKRYRAPFLGDMEEEYLLKVDRIGEQRAKHWYYRQFITSLGPFLYRMIKRLIERRVVT